jgi:hypothetical protein
MIRHRLALLAAFLPWLLALAFVRPYADDFCTIAATREVGSASAFMVYHWYAWSGRYVSMFTSSLSLQIGAWFTPVVIVGLFVAWWIALRRLAGELLATLILLVMLISAPDPFQSYYWLTGALTYLAPLVLATWCIVLADRPALSALIAFASAGFSDVAGLIQLVTFGALTVTWNRRMMLPALVTVIGLALVVSAPGNAVRRSYFPTPQLGASLAASAFALDDLFCSVWAAALLVPIAFQEGRERP